MPRPRETQVSEDLLEDLGARGRELEALRRIARGRRDDAPVLHTIFSPLTTARTLAGSVAHPVSGAAQTAAAPAGGAWSP